MPAPTLAPAPVAPDLRLPGLSIVLPCWNEEDNVAQAIHEALAAASRCASAPEVIVVDDGSTDRTLQHALHFAQRDRRVKLVAHPVNRGYGAAVRSGIAASRMPWVLLTDGDLQFDLQELSGLLALAAEHDVVAGYRIDRADPLTRRWAAHGWNWLMRRSFGVSVRDVDCAFKLVRGPELRDLGLVADGAMVSTELYARAAARGLRIAEAGVHHRPRIAGEPSGGDLRVIKRALAERRELRRLLRSPAAASLAPSAVAVAARPARPAVASAPERAASATPSLAPAPAAASPTRRRRFARAPRTSAAARSVALR